MTPGETDGGEPPAGDVRFPRRPYEPGEAAPPRGPHGPGVQPIEMPGAVYGPPPAAVPAGLEFGPAGPQMAQPVPDEPPAPEAAYGGPPPGFGDPARTAFGRLLARLRSLFAR
jgi:hypothetical protein